MLNKLLKTTIKEIDLTNDKHTELITETVQSILEAGYTIDDIKQVEQKLLVKNDNSLIFPLLSLKIAKSKFLAGQVKKPFRIVFDKMQFIEFQRLTTTNKKL